MTVQADQRPGAAARTARPVTLDLLGYLAPAGLMALALALKLALYGGASQDEAEWLLKSQSFQWGYDVENPPLVMWLGLAVRSLFGGGLATLLTLKFALLAGFYALLYWAARTATGQAAPALAIATAPMALYYVAWVPLNSYTHSVMLLAAMAGTAAAAVALLRRPRPLVYLAFGVAAAAGLLAKYNFAPFLGGLLLALAVLPAGRTVLASWWSLAALALTAALTAPHFLWLASHASDVAGATAGNLQASGNAVLTALLALPVLGQALLQFVLPLAVLLPLWFAKPLLRELPGAVTQSRLPAARLLGWQMLFTLALFLAIALLVGATHWRVHYLYPLALFGWPVIAAAWARGADARRLLSFALAGLVLQVAALATLGGHALTQGVDCSRCGEHIEYAAVAEELRAAGYDGGGTIVSISTHKLYPGENLEPYFPQARTISTKWPMTRPPAPRNGGCLLVWPVRGYPDMPQRITGSAVPPFDAPLPPPAASGRLPTPLRHAEGPGPGIGYALWPEPAAHCQRL